MSQLLAQTLQLGFQPLHPGIGFAYSRAQFVGLEAQALGFDATVSELRLKLLDDVGGGVLGHAP